MRVYQAIGALQKVPLNAIAVVVLEDGTTVNISEICQVTGDDKVLVVAVKPLVLYDKPSPHA